MKMFPCFLRETGYFCTNNSKEDYNLEKTDEVWDISSREAHWRKREPGQRFFAVFNITVSHESQIRMRPHTLIHDPTKVRVPAYHPDTPEVRRDWAQYYDKITEMDAHVGRILKELEDDSLEDETIVFYYADHGSGMPRNKRWLYNSGLHVPLVVLIPEKFRHLASADYTPGGKSDRLIGFVDLGPTVLSLSGMKPPDYMQGRAFLGEYTTPELPFAFGLRGRMDEKYDMVRSVRDKRHIYIRNYMPHKIYGQHLDYMFQTPTTRVWKALYDQCKLVPPQTYFWETKPPEELYDLENDPDEVNNLADSPERQEILKRLRKALQEWMIEVRDVGFLPEDEIHSRSESSSPYEMGHDDKKYPLKRIMATAELASFLEEGTVPRLARSFRDDDSAVRYWAVMGILMRGAEAVRVAKSTLHEALSDVSPSVRVIAAEALGRYGDEEDVAKALEVLIDLARIDENGVYVSVSALNALDALGDKARRVADVIRTLPKDDPMVHPRMKDYVPRLLEEIMGDFE
jgi:uncharacterized sulfatase